MKTRGKNDATTLLSTMRELTIALAAYVENERSDLAKDVMVHIKSQHAEFERIDQAISNKERDFYYKSDTTNQIAFLLSLFISHREDHRVDWANFILSQISLDEEPLLRSTRSVLALTLILVQRLKGGSSSDAIPSLLVPYLITKYIQFFANTEKFVCGAVEKSTEEQEISMGVLIQFTYDIRRFLDQTVLADNPVITNYIEGQLRAYYNGKNEITDSVSENQLPSSAVEMLQHPSRQAKGNTKKRFTKNKHKQLRAVYEAQTCTL